MLSMKAKYALRASMVLAAQAGKMLQSKMLAKEADAPVKFLEAILLELKNHDIVESKRGIFGGYFLKSSPNDISAGDIIRIIDGTLAPLCCASVGAYKKCEDCLDEQSCVIRALMIEVRNATAGVLDRYSLADMVALQGSQAKRRLHGRAGKIVQQLMEGP